MIAATLFSGIGAPETAMPQWQWVWSAEIEKFPSAVLAARHPHSVNLGDVTADGFAERAAAIARPDVIVFGSPCQSFSVAGRRLGLDDPRGNLALVALGIINRLKPRWFVFENVPGLLSSASGRDFGLFLRAVGDIGYSLAWTMLDAQYFGLAQRRSRVFAVGHLGDWRYPAAVLFEPESLCGNHPPRRQTGERTTGPIAGCSNGGGANGPGRSADDADSLIAFHENQRAEVKLNDTVGALNDGGGKPGQGYPAVALRGREGGATAELSELPSALRASSGGGDKAHVLINQVRRLTPRECERLQGFPDDYTVVEYRGKQAADGPRYKALGNSMAVPVVRWILSRIEQMGGE